MDSIAISLDGGKTSAPFPAIIKTSILMLDQMLEHGIHNAFVFPEQAQSLFLFMVAKLLHNIHLGKINYEYDFGKFETGERIKIGNAVAEFLDVIDNEGTTKIRIRFSDLTYEAPVELFPLFQQTDTKRPLSASSKYQKEKQAIQDKLAAGSKEERAIAGLAEHKTHMESSLAFVSTLTTVRSQLEECLLHGHPVDEVLLVGQAMIGGDVKSIGPGQLSGIPALLLSPDLYSVEEACQAGAPLQSIIIDATNSSIIENQADVLDRLMLTEMPIAVVASTVDSFDFDSLEERGFTIWRWNESCITPSLYNTGSTPIKKKLESCAHQSISFFDVCCHELSDAISILNKHRAESELFSSGMAKVYDDMYSLTFDAIREVTGFSQETIFLAQKKLDEGLEALISEQRFISEETFEEFGRVLTSLGSVYSTSFTLPKQIFIKEHLQENKFRKVCMVIPERAAHDLVKDYWNAWLSENGLETQLDVFHPGEYYLLDCPDYEATFVTGWLKRAIMRKILFSYNTDSYIIPLYECEREWKNYSINRWRSQIGGDENRNIASHHLKHNGVGIHIDNDKEALAVDAEEAPSTDELGKTEQIIKANRLRRYTMHGGTSANGGVEAIPVSFVGDYIMFYRVGHKAIVATKIVNRESDHIEPKQPSELAVGDYVAVREADRDIIKEFADRELELSGEGHLRGLSGKWRDALKAKAESLSLEDLYEELQDAGCDRGFQTVRNWLYDEDLIAPQSKDDLELIALVTDDDFLMEEIEEVFFAAQKVKAAHVKAGQHLSRLLRENIAEALEGRGAIDASSIWKPINLFIEDIGMVRLLKIVDIGSAITVEFNYTNKLIKE